MALQIKTTDSEFHELERVAGVARDGTASVSVPKEALQHLIADHLTLLAAATGPVSRGGKAHTIAAGPDQGSLR